MAVELDRIGRARRVLVELRRAGRAIRVPDESLERIALAQVSGARVLCTDDHPLMQDFKNRELLSNPRGRVYQRAEHAALLGHTRACSRRISA